MHCTFYCLPRLCFTFRSTIHQQLPFLLLFHFSFPRFCFTFNEWNHKFSVSRQFQFQLPLSALTCRCWSAIPYRSSGVDRDQQAVVNTKLVYGHPTKGRRNKLCSSTVQTQKTAFFINITTICWKSNLDDTICCSCYKPFVARFNINTPYPTLMTTDNLNRKKNMKSIIFCKFNSLSIR